MTPLALPHRLGAAALAAVAGLTAATALAADRGPAPAPAAPVPLVVEDPGRIGEARALAARLAPGAPVEILRVLGPADAAAVVARVAATRSLVVGAGPDVRAALEVARASFPELRTATVAAR